MFLFEAVGFPAIDASADSHASGYSVVLQISAMEVAALEAEAVVAFDTISMVKTAQTHVTISFCCIACVLNQLIPLKRNQRKRKEAEKESLIRRENEGMKCYYIDNLFAGIGCKSKSV
jgi:hypothetical protein